MNIQEQEHWDYEMGVASDAQNAFSLSQMELKPDDSKEINDLVESGKFVACREMEQYCLATDAFLRVDLLYVKHFDTRQEAVDYLEENPELFILPQPNIVEPKTLEDSATLSNLVDQASEIPF